MMREEDSKSDGLEGEERGVTEVEARIRRCTSGSVVIAAIFCNRSVA